MTEQLFSSVDFDTGGSQSACFASQMLDQAERDNFVPGLMQSIGEQGGIPCGATPDDLKNAPGNCGPLCHIDKLTDCLFLQSTPI